MKNSFELDLVLFSKFRYLRLSNLTFEERFCLVIEEHYGNGYPRFEISDDLILYYCLKGFKEYLNEDIMIDILNNSMACYRSKDNWFDNKTWKTQLSSRILGRLQGLTIHQVEGLKNSKENVNILERIIEYIDNKERLNEKN